MQTSPAALRISAASRQLRVQQNTQLGQVIVEDTRLRNWLLAASSGLTGAATCRSVLTGDGNILRIRTLANNTLDIEYATPADSFTFSANTITTNALFQTGVDLYVSGDAVDAFWFDSDGVTLKTAHSSDDGHTWGSASTVATLPTQPTGVLPQLCAPTADTIIFSDSTVGGIGAQNLYTALFISLKVSGSWTMPQVWDLYGQQMGIEAKVTLPDGSKYPSNLSGVPFGTNRIQLAYYGNQFRELFGDGLFVQRAANLDYTNPTQHLHWSQPDIVFKTIPIDDDNEASQIAAAFPRIQLVGSETWILALESSEYAGHIRNHLAFFRTQDDSTTWQPLAWDARDYRQGAANDLDEQSGAYVYNGSTPFQVTDLIYASLVVTPTRTFLCGYDKVFWCPSTSLVGEDNDTVQTDITANLTVKNLSQPAAPTTVQATYPLQNAEFQYNNNPLIVAHRGIMVVQKSGYVTGNGSELIPVGTLNLTQTKQDVALINDKVTNVINLTALDQTWRMQREKVDVSYEYQGIQSFAFEEFCDLSAFGPGNGSFYTNAGGQLVAGVVRSTDNFPDDMMSLLANEMQDGFWETSFRVNTSFANNYLAFDIQGQWGGDAANQNKVFWALLYNHPSTPNKFSFARAVPRTKPNVNTLYRYRPAVAESGSITLERHATYWLAVAVWHGHVMAWYCQDRVNWVNVIDWTSPTSPFRDVLPCRVQYVALTGTQRVSPSAALGQLSGKDGGRSLADGAGNPLIVALRVQLGAGQSTLTQVQVTLTQENTLQQPMPAALVMVLDGDASAPFDATDPDNVLFANNYSALFFGAHSSPKPNGANVPPNPAPVRFSGGEYIWVAVSFANELVSGQSYQYWGDNSGAYGTNTTQVSSDGGATWAGNGTFNLQASVTVDYDAGNVRFQKLYGVSGDPVRTIENISHQIAAKADVLALRSDAWLAQADLTLGGDGVLWQPIVFGTIGDMVLDVDVVVGSGDTATLVIRATEIDAGADKGYQITLDPTAQTISFYAPTGTLIGRRESLQYIPLSFHVQIVNLKQFIIVNINEAMAGMVYNPNLNVNGYVGLVNAGATWSNLRVPDYYQTVQYWTIDAKQTPLQSLQQLIAKPAAGTIARGKFFIDANGALRLLGQASYRGDPVATYTGILLQSSKESTSNYGISESNPEGVYDALHFDGDLLSDEGRVYDSQNYTEAQSNADAYLAAFDIFRDIREKQETYTLDAIYDPALEREDTVIVVNPVDGTSGTYIVNSITPISESVSPTVSRMTLNLRKYAR